MMVAMPSPTVPILTSLANPRVKAVTALRDAFMAMVKDPDFLAEIKKMNADLEPLPGEGLHALVEKTLSTSPEVRQRAKSLFGR